MDQGKVFKNGPSKIFQRLPSTNFTWSILKYVDPNLSCCFHLLRLVYQKANHFLRLTVVMVNLAEVVYLLKIAALLLNHGSNVSSM